MVQPGSVIRFMTLVDVCNVANSSAALAELTLPLRNAMESALYSARCESISFMEALSSTPTQFTWKDVEWPNA